MPEGLPLVTLAWVALLVTSYISVRLMDPWPRNDLRAALNAEFSQQQLGWKLLLLAETLVVFALAMAASYLAFYALIATRTIMMIVALPKLPYSREAQAWLVGKHGLNRDPMYQWYLATWGLPLINIRRATL
jgi:hypothetical protein